MRISDWSSDVCSSDLRSSYRIGYRGRLVAAMHHAVGALLVVAGAIAVPVRLFHEFLEAGSVSLAQQIAGSLPAEDIARGIAPGRASVLLVAGEEVEQHRGLDRKSVGYGKSVSVRVDL